MLLNRHFFDQDCHLPMNKVFQNLYIYIYKFSFNIKFNIDHQLQKY